VTVILTAEEATIVARIDFDPDWQLERERILEICAAAAELTKSLLERDAIPEHRIDYFVDPEFNVGRTTKSRKEIFEGHGTRGEDILEHPHFLKHLYYFIYGARLPNPVIDGFCKIVREDRGTSAEVMSQMDRYVRKEIRDRGLSRTDAAEEFYKLALDCGLYVDRAKGVRRAALTAR
jgi:hypothetical protein